jgi:hypothetical protein
LIQEFELSSLNNNEAGNEKWKNRNKGISDWAVRTE